MKTNKPSHLNEFKKFVVLGLAVSNVVGLKLFYRKKLDDERKQTKLTEEEGKMLGKFQVRPINTVEKETTVRLKCCF